MKADKGDAKGESKDDTKPPPQLEALDYFVGIWSFKGRMEASADSPARDLKGTMICRWELGKFFLGVAKDDELSLQFPRRRQSRAYWGYDTGARLYTCSMFYFGGARFVATSRGWNRDTLAFSGEMITAGQSTGARLALTQKSDSELIIRVDLVGPEGDLSRHMELRCHREGEG
jgi:hypothetical protein